MHTTIVKTKDGQEYTGTLEKFRPSQNWFSLVVYDPLVNLLHEKMFSFSDCLSVITKGERISKTQIGDYDEMNRARQDLIDGRKLGWTQDGKPYPQEKFDWE